MELCTARYISNLPHYRLFNSSQTRFHQFHRNFHASQISRFNFNSSGMRYYTDLSVRSSLSDETSRGTSPYAKDGPGGVITLDDTRPVEKEYGEQNEAPKEDSPEDQVQQFELLEKLDIKFDSDNTYSILLFGGSSLVTLYLAIVIVGAIDSIPLFPNLMEVVGLSYTLWFSTRYLLFQKNREELAAKIGDIKQQILGSDGD